MYFLALINLLKFVLSNETYLVKKHDIFLLSSKVRQYWWIPLQKLEGHNNVLSFHMRLKFSSLAHNVLDGMGSESYVAEIVTSMVATSQALSENSYSSSPFKPYKKVIPSLIFQGSLNYYKMAFWLSMVFR